MSATDATPPLLPTGLSAPSPQKALRKLFLTLFLRGRGARGLQRGQAPKSVGTKLGMMLGFYALFGFLALVFVKQPVFALAVYLHSMTFAFLAMFVAASAGEILFNKEEADILLHRPIEPKVMLWSKISVLVEVSLWLAGAINLVGFFVGLAARDGGWRFPFAHVLSTILEALFCSGSVVLVYQLCLRWFGREKLEGLMTTAQVLLSVAAVLSGQILPRYVMQAGNFLSASKASKWIFFLPPAWFAGLDDALAGSAAGRSWVLGGLCVIVTGAVLAMAFGKLAQDYASGWQTLSEAAPKSERRGRRALDWLVARPPLRWWLRDPVERAAFLLATAYLIRDRDVKLRVYPGIAPMLIVPILFLLPGQGFHGDFGGTFAGAYLGMVPLMGVSLLRYSQQWQASDIFRTAPMPGPAPLCLGAMRAVLFLLTLPVMAVFGLIMILMHGKASILCLLLPGLVVLPVYALIPAVFSNAVPLSLPTEEAKSVGRGGVMMLLMFISLAISGLASVAWKYHWFWPMLGVEIIVAGAVYFGMRAALAKVRWESAE